MFTDSHCHIDFEVFDKDRNQILQNCLKKNITRLIVPSVKSTAWQRTLELCQQKHQSVYPKLLPALGLHPYFLTEHNESDLQCLESYCKAGKLSAIGETGLDFYLKNLDKPQQVFYFQAQLALAQKYHLPIIIHARKSHQDILQLLKKYQPLKGIIHAYNGCEIQARQYIDLGFKLGFGGAFTYPRAKKLRYLVSSLPLDAMVLETDAPDMLPFFIASSNINNQMPMLNSPDNIVGIFKEFAFLREEKTKQIETQLEKNIDDIFFKLI